MIAMSEDRFSRTEAFLCANAFCFLLFVYAPLDVFWANCQDFYFDLYIMLPYVFAMYVISVSVAFLFFTLDF